ncbi:MAG TPA: hypothetical protein VK493_10050 [Bryobacteraceae bacterium]|nr:hypothetical protein [Bryobacteraceae bacterium]
MSNCLYSVGISPLRLIAVKKTTDQIQLLLVCDQKRVSLMNTYAGRQHIGRSNVPAAEQPDAMDLLPSADCTWVAVAAIENTMHGIAAKECAVCIELNRPRPQGNLGTIVKVDGADVITAEIGDD